MEYSKWNELQYFQMFKDGKISVFCASENAAKKFCNYLFDKGLRWCDGDTLKNNPCYLPDHTYEYIVGFYGVARNKTAYSNIIVEFRG